MQRSMFVGGALLVCSALVMSGCGGGGGATGGTGGGDGSVLNPSLLGYLQILGSDPVDDAVEVELSPQLTVKFDAAVEPGTLNSSEFALRKVGTTTAIPGTYSTSNQGRWVTYSPSAPLEKACDYEFVVAPTVVDANFRATDVEYVVTFRTIDDVPPQVVSASVSNNQTSVSHTGTLSITFDERLDESALATTIALRDPWGASYDVDISHQSGVVYVTPAHDLPGLSQFILSARGGAGGVRDRSGNALEEDWSIRFTTEMDGTAPSLMSSDPVDSATGISPNARLSLQFSESIDDASFDPSGVVLLDADLNPVPFTVDSNRDHTWIYLRPRSALTANSTYTLTLRSAVTGLSDFSGNALNAETLIRFDTGDDTTAPQVLSTTPLPDALRVSPNVVIDIGFDAALEPRTVNRETVTLSDGSNTLYITPTLSESNTKLSVIPSSYLDPSQTYTLRIRSGYDGLQDKAGNPLASDYLLSFSTSASSTLPEFVISPGHGTTSVPNTARMTIIANEVLDPASVSSSTILVEDSVSGVVPGSFAVTQSNRAIVFSPTAGFSSGATITVTVLGEAQGVRLASGNWPTRDSTATFYVGFSGDSLRPELTLTLNDVASARNEGLLLPTWSFTIDATMRDVGNLTVDPASLQFTLSGPGSVPGSEELFETGSYTQSSAHLSIDSGLALEPGSYTLQARVADLSGNWSLYDTISFDISEASAELRPFERLQLVWVRFDMDREGHGQGDGDPDFDQDLMDYGLMTAGDPSGTNDRMRTLIRDGILRQAHLLYGRASDGSPQAGSVPIRLVLREPSSAPHMRIAIGGNDPNGASNRSFGAESSGILGRAYYDFRNSSPNENNTGTSPGLGVFPGELFLYQSRLYLDLYPYYYTTFARTFGVLSPHMGGTPAGAGVEDATVLATGFNRGTATSAQIARYDAIMDAADDLATAIGTILAHEIGHSLGLTAPGACPTGLHGDQSLHNAATSFTDVMSAVISYESLIAVDFEFRPLNLAYLRERILTR
jgi:hypothetical protein